MFIIAHFRRKLSAPYALLTCFECVCTFHKKQYSDTQFLATYAFHVYVLRFPHPRGDRKQNPQKNKRADTIELICCIDLQTNTTRHHASFIFVFSSLS
jgi:hypothetical protein